MQSCKNALCVLATLCCITLVSGCGDEGTDTPAVFPVGGKVTLDNQPLAGARITFFPLADGGKGGGYATTKDDGTYKLTNGKQPGCVPGQFKVVITHYLTREGKPFQENPEEGMDIDQAIEGGQVKQSLPSKYSDPRQTELTATIKEEENDAVDFPLVSK